MLLPQFWVTRLVVTGDNDDNQVEIVDLGDGTYYVEGFDDTTINEQEMAGPFTSFKGIKVDLKAGDDGLDMIGDPEFIVLGDLSIKMGDGRYDTVLLENAEIGGKTTIDLGRGAGFVAISAADFAKDVTVKSGDAPGVENTGSISRLSRPSDRQLSVTTGKTNKRGSGLNGVWVTKK